HDRRSEPPRRGMKIDAALASPFHLDWLVDVDDVTEDDYARAVAEKADVLLRSAQFLDVQRLASQADVEVRVWVEAACGPACVSITYEPGIQRHGFHLLDETLRERLACVVFEDMPCVDGEQSEAQADEILAAAIRAMREAQQRGLPLEEIARMTRDAEP